MSRNINPVPQFFDGSGDPVISGKMFYFETGTTTQKTTFADSSLTIANAHPVLLDGAGRLPNVFFNGTAKQILTTSDDIQLWERDPVGGDTGVTFGADWVATQTYSIEAVVRGSDGAYYRSLINNNSNNDPTTSAVSWELLEFGRAWNTNVTYSVGNSAYGSDGLLYKSLTSSNVGNDPASDVVNWGSGASEQINFYDDSGAADAYVLAVAAGGSKPKALVDGLPIEFVAANVNTGASTVSVAGLGVKDIKLAGGANPAAGQVNGRTQLIYDLGNDWAELVRTGPVTTIVTATDATWDYTPGVKTAIVTAIGAGAGAGGIDGQGAGTAAVARAGSGAGFSIKTVDGPTGTLNITIGVAGPGGAAGDFDGTDGGDTTVVGTGISITAEGGNLGLGNLGSSASTYGSSTAGGLSSGGDINGKGVYSGMRAVIAGDVAAGSDSGFCPIMGGGVPFGKTGSGVNATIPGEGGGAVAEQDTTANRTGGNGFRGQVKIQEFF